MMHCATNQWQHIFICLIFCERERLCVPVCGPVRTVSGSMDQMPSIIKLNIYDIDMRVLTVVDRARYPTL